MHDEFRSTPKRVLAICGSPRKGNTETILTFIQGKLTCYAGINVEIIRLREKEIGFCRSCFKCISKNTCLGIEDDMTLEILPKMLESDLILFASPSYYGTVTGLMKNLMDRCLPLQNLYFPGAIRGKPAINIVIYGRSAGIHLTQATLDYWCLVLGMNVIRNYQFKAMDKNDASKDPSIERQCDEIARNIHEIFVKTQKGELCEQYPRIIVNQKALTSAWKSGEPQR